MTKRDDREMLARARAHEVGGYLDIQYAPPLPPWVCTYCGCQIYDQYIRQHRARCKP